MMLNPFFFRFHEPRVHDEAINRWPNNNRARVSATQRVPNASENNTQNVPPLSLSLSLHVKGHRRVHFRLRRLLLLAEGVRRGDIHVHVYDVRIHQDFVRQSTSPLSTSPLFNSLFVFKDDGTTAEDPVIEYDGEGELPFSFTAAEMPAASSGRNPPP